LNKLSSVAWGVLASILGSVVENIVGVGLIGVVVAALLYFLVLKDKNINLVYYILGYFLFFIIAFILLGSMIGGFIIFGGLAI